MKFLVDESSGRRLADHLSSEGHDAVYVGRVMAGADDARVLETAAGEERILITNDKDFGTHVFQNGQETVGVMLLRLQVDTAANRITVVDRVIGNYGEKLPGTFAVVEDDRVRFRDI